MNGPVELAVIIVGEGNVKMIFDELDTVAGEIDRKQIFNGLIWCMKAVPLQSVQYDPEHKLKLQELRSQAYFCTRLNEEGKRASRTATKVSLDIAEFRQTESTTINIKDCHHGNQTSRKSI